MNLHPDMVRREKPDECVLLQFVLAQQDADQLFCYRIISLAVGIYCSFRGIKFN